MILLNTQMYCSSLLILELLDIKWQLEVSQPLKNNQETKCYSFKAKVGVSNIKYIHCSSLLQTATDDMHHDAKAILPQIYHSVLLLLLLFSLT